MESRILALTDEAVVLHTKLKSKTLTPEEHRRLLVEFEETMALKIYLETELAKQTFLRDVPWTLQELDCPPEDQLMRGPVGAGGGL